MKTEESTAPRWLTLKAASIYSGLNIRTLQNYISEELIISSTVKRLGASRGRRLVCRQSLDTFIEAGIGQNADVTFMPKK